MGTRVAALLDGFAGDPAQGYLILNWQAFSYHPNPSRPYRHLPYFWQVRPC